MRQLLVYIMLVVFGIGTVFAPVGGLSGNKYISAMYASCLAEDLDVSMIDFVFEHLLSLETVVEFLEHEDGDEEDELPISIPVQQTSPTVVVIGEPLSIPPAPATYSVLVKDYSLYHNSMKLSSYTNEVFHPPAA